MKMNGWAEGIQNAIEYMEAHLTDELDVREIAAQAYVSAFHFQRIFSALCGFTVGEYIRKRRLTLAAYELAATDAKVIDVAVKYGYDSSDSFARAFTKFHGVSPSVAKEKGVELKAFAPLKIRLTLEGATMMDYKIVEKAAFTVMGKARRFNSETSYAEIPKFWEAHMQSGETQLVCGMYGVCMDSVYTDGNGMEFEYLIADNYIPWKEIPEGCVTRVIPAGTWAVFPCRGAWPKAIQDVNTGIWDEWLPNCKEYRLAGNYSIEMYAPPSENPDENYCEIWIPVEKI